MQTTKTSQQKKQTGTQALPYQKLFCTCVVKHKKFKISDNFTKSLKDESKTQHLKIRTCTSASGHIIQTKQMQSSVKL